MMPRMLRMGILLTGVMLVLASGCNRKIKPFAPGVTYKPNDVAVRVDGQKMTWDQMEKRARNYLQDEVNSKTLVIPPGSEEKAMEFYRRKALVLFVNKTVMLEDARARGITVSPADRQKFVAEMETLLKERKLASSLDEFFQKSPLGEKETRREFEDGLIVDKFIQQGVRDKVVVTDADREALAKEVIAKRQAARQKADTLRAQLLVKGADFNAVLEKEKTSPDKLVISGDLGEVVRGRVGDKQLEDAIFGQKLNEIGPILDTPRGFMLFRVTSRTAAKPAVGASPAQLETAHAVFFNVRTPPLLKGKDMDRVIQSRKFDKDLNDLLKSLRAKAKIETIYKDLVF